MEIRIGILHASRELSFETDADADEVTGHVTQALGDADQGQLRLHDNKGNTFIVPVANIAYVQLGSSQSRRIGFVG